MRICLCGDFSSPLSEGMRNTAFHLGRELARSHEVLPLDVMRPPSPALWRGLRRFRPHIVHYLSGPSLKSLALLKMVSLCSGSARSVALATHPCLNLFSRLFMPVLRPDLVLAVSEKDREMFSGNGCRTDLLPLGVDWHGFAPVPAAARLRLREKYGLPAGAFIILHVGPLVERRGLRLLGRLQGRDKQVLVVTGGRTDERLLRSLEAAGCLVWGKYLPDIKEVYALSDCYVFPASHDLSCVRMPLSVLEAMACNLPVIATRFGALPDLFRGDGDGFIFAATEDEFISGLERLRSGVNVRNREKVRPFSWDMIAGRLSKIYEELIEA